MSLSPLLAIIALFTRWKHQIVSPAKSNDLMSKLATTWVSSRSLNLTLALYLTSELLKTRKHSENESSKERKRIWITFGLPSSEKLSNARILSVARSNCSLKRRSSCCQPTWKTTLTRHCSTCTSRSDTTTNRCSRWSCRELATYSGSSPTFKPWWGTLAAISDWRWMTRMIAWNSTKPALRQR